MANYQTGNFQYVVPTTYNPLSLQERLPIVMLYKDAYDKRRQEYIDLADKAGTFDYLRTELPEDSKARQIYENYANGFNEVAKDFSRNGLNLANGRDLLNYRRRYKSEIGRLEEANTAMEKEIDRRTALNANDPTMLYATDNFSIDDFLDKKKPSTYSVSGQKLYERGVQIGASDSSRIWSDPQIKHLNDMFLDAVQTNGLSPELLAQWRSNLDAIPSFRDHLNATLKEYGVTDNLTGNNFERAKQSIMNGMINGAIYKKSDSIQQNPDYWTKKDLADIDYKNQSLEISGLTNGLKKVNGHWQIDSNSLVWQTKNKGSDSSNYVNDEIYDSAVYYGNSGTPQSADSSDKVNELLSKVGGGKVKVVYAIDKSDGLPHYKIFGNKTGELYVDVKTDPVKGTYETTVLDHDKHHKFGEDFDVHSGGLFNPLTWNRFDADYDDKTFKAMGDKIAQMAIGGEHNFENYDFFYSPDNGSNSNNDGGFAIVSYNRVQKTDSND